MSHLEPGRQASSRRSFLQLSTAASAALALHIVTEPMLAQAKRLPFSKDAVMIDSNENPLGPCSEAREAIIGIVPQGGRYSINLTDDFLARFTQKEGLKPDYVDVFPGSSAPLHYSLLSFTSPTRSYVTADPGYEAGLHGAEITGARIVKVPLTKTYAHDVKAMVASAPDAGLFYVCSPNNPTGTLTSHEDIEDLLEHKPKDAIVLVDEAYIHFSDAPSAIDLVKADKDVIVLRTFSKIYGMAGLRCGVAIARPDLIARLGKFNGWNAMPITAVVAASASLKDAQLVPDRKQINAQVREETFEWLDHNGYAYIRSESNFFMLDTKRPGKEAIAAMAKQKVHVGRIWPALPTYVRVTVGTKPEMERFQAAFKQVMNGAVTASLQEISRKARRHLDGVVLRA